MPSTTSESKLEVNPKEELPPGSSVDKVVLRYSQPSHRTFFSSVMNRLQQPEVSPRQLLSALTDAVEEMERDEAKKAEEEARRVEEEKKRAEEEKRRADEEAKKAEEEAKKAEEEAKKAEEEAKLAAEMSAKKAQEEAMRAAEEQMRAADEARNAKYARMEAIKAEAARIVEEERRAEEAKKEEEARKLEETRKAEEEAREQRLMHFLEGKLSEEATKRAVEATKLAAEISAMRACGVCNTPDPKARAVFATCGHVACLKCAEGAAARATRLECPFCDAPTTYMRLFEREQVTKAVVASPKLTKGVRFSETHEVKEFEKDENETDKTVALYEKKECNSLGCILPWFGGKDN